MGWIYSFLDQLDRVTSLTYSPTDGAFSFVFLVVRCCTY